MPWQAGVADVGSVTAIIGLLLATAYLSSQSIAAVLLCPDRAHGLIGRAVDSCGA